MLILRRVRCKIGLSVLAALLLATLLTGFADAAPIVLPPDNALTAEQLGVIINDDDPLSIAIGNYYQQRRKIPAANIVHIRFSTGKSEMEPGEFAVLKRLVDERLPATVQALALTWATPYRVGCMSITAAFTFGYDVRYCAEGCKTTETSSYANSTTRKPFTSLNIRPTMMLAATNKQFAFALIERGIEADGSVPNGAAYLIETSDTARSARKVLFPGVRQLFGDLMPVHIEQAPSLENAKDVMLYTTGAITVPKIDSNHYLPGAIADHLTSYGGQLTDSSQMSALRWLEAGVTGSYGTVVEPCAFIQKFPNPQILLQHYLAGETLIEAYWKSVLMPGQGVFIGEPLARPYGAYRVTREGSRGYVGGPALDLKAAYNIFAADKPQGPFIKVATATKPSPLTQSLELPQPIKAYYRLEPLISFDNYKPWLP
jgi:uncharacterized protein (TIGR03790 family)